MNGASSHAKLWDKAVTPSHTVTAIFHRGGFTISPASAARPLRFCNSLTTAGPVDCASMRAIQSLNTSDDVKTRREASESKRAIIVYSPLRCWFSAGRSICMPRFPGNVQATSKNSRMARSKSASHPGLMNRVTTAVSVRSTPIYTQKLLQLSLSLYEVN